MKQQLNLMPLAQQQPGPPINVRFQLVFKATNTPVQCPAFVVPPGASITLRTVNGATVNANECFVAERYALLGTSSQMAFPAGADVSLPWPVQNTAEIFAQGTMGDGLLVMVQLSQIE